MKQRRPSSLSLLTCLATSLSLVSCTAVDDGVEAEDGQTSDTGETAQAVELPDADEGNSPTTDLGRRPRPQASFPACDDSIDCCPAGFERVEGTSGDDDLDGIFTVPSCLAGFDGDDRLDGSNADNVLLGGPGADDIDGGFGKDIVLGAEGDDDIRTIHEEDEIDAGPGNDEIDAGFDNDIVFGREGHDEIDGGDGDDWISAGPGDDIVDGGFEQDYIEGNAGDDEIEGGIGDDTIIPGPGRDEVDGEIGDDTVIINDVCELETGEVLDGGFAGNDTLVIPIPLAEVQALGVTVDDFETIVTSPNPGASECSACQCNAVGGTLTCCNGHGTCQPSGDTFECQCDADYYGSDCSLAQSGTGSYEVPGCQSGDPACDTVLDQYAYEVLEVPCDVSLQDPLLVDFMFPDDIGSYPAGSLPIVVFQHGNGQSFSRYPDVLGAIVQNEFVVANVDGSQLGGDANTRADLNICALRYGRNDWQWASKVSDVAVIMGHSSGGKGAIFTPSRLPDPQDQRGSPHVAGVVAVSPGEVLQQNQPSDITIQDAPAVLVIHGSHDPQVPSEAFRVYDRLDRDLLRAFVYIHEMSHDDFGGDMQLGPDDSVIIANAYVGALLEWWVRGNGARKAFFTGEETSPAANAVLGTDGLSRRVFLQLLEGLATRAQQIIVDDVENRNPPALNPTTIGGAIETMNSSASTGEPNFVNPPHFAHVSNAVSISWPASGPDSSVRFTIPAGSADVQDFEVLSFRVGNQFDGDASTCAGASLPLGDLGVTLSSVGGTQTVLASDLRGPETLTGQIGYGDPWIGPQSLSCETRSSYSTIRVPLSDFEPGVDLSDVRSVEFTWDSTAAGGLFVDDIEFLETNDGLACGNGVRIPSLGEECDGTDLGGEDCTSMGFGSGTLGCSAACEFDTSDCDPCPTMTYTGGSCPPQCTACVGDTCVVQSPIGGGVALSGTIDCPTGWACSVHCQASGGAPPTGGGLGGCLNLAVSCADGPCHVSCSNWGCEGVTQYCGEQRCTLTRDPLSLPSATQVCGANTCECVLQ